MSLAHEIEDHSEATEYQGPRPDRHKQQTVTRPENGLLCDLAISQFWGFGRFVSLEEPHDTCCYQESRKLWPTMLLVVPVVVEIRSANKF